jgi:hypothetical protein
MVDPELPRLRVFLRTTQAKNLIEPRISRQNARAQANFLTTWFSAGAGRQHKSPISLNASEANRGHRWAPPRPPYQIRSNEDRRSN